MLAVDILCIIIASYKRRRQIDYRCICITGTTNGLGKEIVKQITRKIPKAQLILIDIQTPINIPQNSIFYRADITNMKQLNPIFQKYPIDLLVSFFH